MEEMSGRVSVSIRQRITGRDFSRAPVSDTSNTYRIAGLSPESSRRAIPLEPRRTKRPILLFHNSYSAQAVAVGRCA
ncbi:MAG: hypothetical protein J6V24_02700 [Clostridia bacterium]|nr:hypothetical protein [Clostridia bacterium]